MSISLSNYDFEGPYSMTAMLRNQSGVYAILTPTSKKRYRLVDVGESGSIKDRMESHDRKSCWERNAANTGIRYAVHYTPGASVEQRRKIENEVRDQYGPPCGQQ